MKITNRHNGSVIFSDEKIESLKDLVAKAVAKGAYLRGAGLRGAYLRGADLRGADLRGADLGGADLGGAYLGGADLGGADLRGASYCLTSVFLSLWENVPDNLNLEMMRWDATLIPDPEQMDRWAIGGDCPCPGKNGTQKMFGFNPKKELWKPGKPEMTLRELFVALCKANEIKIGEA